MDTLYFCSVLAGFLTAIYLGFLTKNIPFFIAIVLLSLIPIVNTLTVYFVVSDALRYWLKSEPEDTENDNIYDHLNPF